MNQTSGALLRWIDHLMRLDRMDDTLARVEKAATDALVCRAEKPCMGGLPLVHGVPADALAPAYLGAATRAMAAQARDRAQAAFTSDANKQRLAAALQELRVVDAPLMPTITSATPTQATPTHR